MTNAAKVWRRKRRWASLVALALVFVGRSAHAQDGPDGDGEDGSRVRRAKPPPDRKVPDAPAPPTLPALTHRELTVQFQYTGATILPSPLEGSEETPERALAWFVHLDTEVPLAPRRWYFGFATDMAAGFVPNIGSRILLGNPEVWGRGVWSNRSGLASGGGLGVVLPVPQNLDDDQKEVLRTVRVVRIWDSAYFSDLTLTIRPFFEVRHITGRFVFQVRQGIDWAYSFRDEHGDFSARATFYAGYQLLERLNAGLELWEVYQLTADLPDDKRAAFSISPSVRLLLPGVSPALSVILPIATPLRGDVESYVAGRINVDFAFDIHPASKPAPQPTRSNGNGGTAPN